MSSPILPPPAPAQEIFVPKWMVILAIIAMPSIVIASLAISTGTAAACNMFLGFGAFGVLWMLWTHSSTAKHIEPMEFVLGIAILAVGAAIGSSPTAYPTLAQYWEKTPLRNASPIQAPKPEYWTVDSRTISATKKLPNEVHLVILLPGNARGTFVDANGFVVPDGIDEVRVFLQNRVDDRTSSSLSVAVK